MAVLFGMAYHITGGNRHIDEHLYPIIVMCRALPSYSFVL